MASRLYFRISLIATREDLQYVRGKQVPRLDSRNSDACFVCVSLTPEQGTGTYNWYSVSVAGTTTGIEVLPQVQPYDWVSSPIAEDISVSGTISANLWGYETSMSANTTIGCVVYRVDSQGEISEIGRSASTTEFGTSSALRTFTISPTSTDLFKGDRICLRSYFDDAGTMGAGYAVYFSFNGSTPGAAGDSWVEFTEDVSFITSAPAGTTVYLTNTASDVSTAAVDRVAWTDRGSGVQTDVTNTVLGWTDPIQITDTAGGTVVDWWTPGLAAFTLGGAVKVNARGNNSNSIAYASPRIEIAVTDSDGSNPVVWGSNGSYGFPSTGEDARPTWVSGPDTSVSTGQRLRIRIYIDDTDSQGHMQSGYTSTFYYAGTSSGASGDSYLVFSQTLEADSPGPGGSSDAMPFIGGGYYPS